MQQTIFIILLRRSKWKQKNVLDRSENMSVSTGLQYVMDRCGTDQKAITHDGNKV